MTRAIPFACAAAALALVAGAALGQAHEMGSIEFSSLDANRNGTLGKLEVIGKLPGLAAGFDIADRNRDGSLDRREYARAALAAGMYGPGVRAAYKRDVFRSLDMDGDYAVSRTEAQWRPDVARDFEPADRDGNGSLDMEEFGRVSFYTIAPPGARAEFSFGDLDVNNDQQLGRTEASFHAALARRFRQADADGDAQISKTEFDAWNR